MLKLLERGKVGGFYPALSSLCHESLRETAQQVQKKVQIEL